MWPYADDCQQCTEVIELVWASHWHFAGVTKFKTLLMGWCLTEVQSWALSKWHGFLSLEWHSSCGPSSLIYVRVRLKISLNCDILGHLNLKIQRDSAMQLITQCCCLEQALAPFHDLYLYDITFQCCYWVYCLLRWRKGPLSLLQAYRSHCLTAGDSSKMLEWTK